MKVNSDGCGIQCISKVTGIKADKIRKMASADYIGHVEMVSILKRLVKKVKTPFRPTLFYGKNYIVTVPSLNHEGEFHFVVAWISDAGYIHTYDPVTKGKKYVSQSKIKLKSNERKITSWTSIIEINNAA